MTLDKIIKVLEIVSKYVEPSSTWLAADHDIIYLPIHKDTKLSEEDEKALEDLEANKPSRQYDCWYFYT